MQISGGLHCQRLHNHFLQRIMIVYSRIYRSQNNLLYQRGTCRHIQFGALSFLTDRRLFQPDGDILLRVNLACQISGIRSGLDCLAVPAGDPAGKYLELALAAQASAAAVGFDKHAAVNKRLQNSLFPCTCKLAAAAGQE